MRQAILITGATSGIGRAAALRFAQLGHRVFATGRNEAALATLAAQGGEHLETVRLDVTDAASIGAAVARVDDLTAGAGIDVLVNNAGYGQFGPLLDVTDRQLRAVFDTNVFGLMAVTRAFSGAMVKRRAGRILNVSSGGGRVSFPFAGAYTATKFAVEAMSDALRMELAPFGVHVVLVEPGPIKTGFSEVGVASLPSAADGGSPYTQIYARAREAQAKSDAMSWSPATVVRAIERAAFARKPAARYTAPRLLEPLLWLSQLVPTGLQDFVMRKALGLA